MIRNAAYSLSNDNQASKKFQIDSNEKYERYLIPAGLPTNNSFYSFGGRKSINEVKRREEVLSPKLLTSSEFS